MSKYDWERGTLVLPTSEVATVRAALRAAYMAYRATVETQVNTCFKTFGTSRSVKAWVEHKRLFINRLTDQPQSRYSTQRQLDDETLSDIYEVLQRLDKPRTPHVADFDAVLGTKPTNRTTTFVAGEASVVLDGRKISWDSGDNNHQVERARDSWLGQAFFTAMAKVTWTRATGGVLVGNDEYNSDSYDEGGRSNYATASYGPLGSKSRGW